MRSPGVKNTRGTRVWQARSAIAFLAVGILSAAGATISRSAFADDTIATPLFVRDRVDLSHRFPNAAIETATGGCLVVTPPDSAAPDMAVDPRFGWRFSRAVYVFAPRQIGNVKGWFRVVTVRHEPELRDQARQTARLIGRLWSVYRDRFGREVEFPLQAESADVYLATETPKDENGEGGETRNGQIYIFGAGIAKRSALEWVRTVAHEWGHLTLSAARGYQEPESDAAGYLGERLFLKWLYADESQRTANAPSDGTTRADLDLYYRRQIAPLIARFAAGGPGSPILDGPNTAAMDYYIGGVLATDDAFGSAITGRALYTVLADGPRDFLSALRRNLAEAPTFTIQTPAWVPLPKGHYKIDSVQTGLTSSLHLGTPMWRQFATAGTLRLHRVEAAAP